MELTTASRVQAAAARLRSAVAAAVGPAIGTTAGVWLLTAAMSSGALGLYLGAVRHMRAPMQRSPLIGLALVVLFVAAEVFVVHIKFYRESQTFSLSEIALVVGLFFAPPGVLVAATLLGGGLALVVHRRQPVVKLAFNLASFACTTLSAVTVFHLVGVGADPLGRAWVAALAAVLAASVVGVITVFSVIAISEGSI
ncbi:MAG TPA: hypothetical protein VFP61_01050, partial [Acidimicrobiales bacterium]|nr:hypothetical protein [Acidimicrobiales bacterium]